MCTRGPAMSVSCGATTRSTPVPSSCQASRRSSPGSALAEPQTAIVSAPSSRTSDEHVAAGVHRHRGLDAAGRRVAVGDVDGDRDQAGGRAAGDRGVDLERLGQRADQHHPVRAVAGAAPGQVQHLPGEQRSSRMQISALERDQGDRAAGQLGLGGEREQRHAGHDGDRGADDPLELLAAQARGSGGRSCRWPRAGSASRAAAPRRRRSRTGRRRAGSPSCVLEAGLRLLQEGGGQISWPAAPRRGRGRPGPPCTAGASATRRLCCRVQAERGTPLLGGGSCCHSKLSYGTGLLRLLSVTGRCRLVVTSPTSSRIRKRLRTATSSWVRRVRRIPVAPRRSVGPGHYTDGSAGRSGRCARVPAPEYGQSCTRCVR